VRLHAYAVFLLLSLTLVLAGCGGGDEQSSSWDGPPDAAADGTIAVDGFNAYAQDVDEPWKSSAAMSAAQFLRLDQHSAASTSIEGRASPEGTGPEVVTVTLDRLADDSIRAMRWVLSFSEENDVYMLTGAHWAQRCQQGRGHQDFTPEACV
jgi:hypothetical protein